MNKTERKKPIIFIAYAKEDDKQINNLYSKLKEFGLNPWLDEKNLLPGQVWKNEIHNAIHDSDLFIACLSNNSVAKKGYVQKEFRTALDIYSERPPGDIYFIPIRLDDCTVPDLKVGTINLREIQWVDLYKQDGFERLLESIKTKFSEKYDDLSTFNLTEKEYTILLFKRTFTEWTKSQSIANNSELNLFYKYRDKLAMEIENYKFIIESALAVRNDPVVWLNCLSKKEQWIIIKYILKNSKYSKVEASEFLKGFKEEDDFVSIVSSILDEESAEQVLINTISIISEIDNEKLFEKLVFLFIRKRKDYRSEKVVAKIIDTFGKLGNKKAVNPLLDFFDEELIIGENHHLALKTLAKLKDKSAIERIKVILKCGWFGNEAIGEAYEEEIKNTIKQLETL